jgi:hypothetical protein
MILFRFIDYIILYRVYIEISQYIAFHLSPKIAKYGNIMSYSDFYHLILLRIHNTNKYSKYNL